ncbi:NAD(P)H-dependent oxidoreductase [Bacillus sp. NPDC077027]|uniref:NAD(P)H-dependent oxidoreductase n=1 Tax=Bacillus sp. NPDC077027 TaxID=3390548 RepID=UPI003CFD6FC3
MNHLVVFAHPHKQSLNHAILDIVVETLKKNGHQVKIRDLYMLDFQPVLRTEEIQALRVGVVPDDIKKEQAYITESDVITFIFPIWWTGLPAILKGYVDRVFSEGFAYRASAEGIKKRLNHKKGLIINTHGSLKEKYDATGMTAGLKMTTDTGIFDFVGIEPVEHLLFGSIDTASSEYIQEIFQETKETVQQLFPSSAKS